MRTWGLALVLWAVSLLPAGAEELRLEDLVTVALKNNPDISVAEARAESARQRISREGSLMDPMLSVGYQNEGFEKYTSIKLLPAQVVLEDQNILVLRRKEFLKFLRLKTWRFFELFRDK